MQPRYILFISLLLAAVLAGQAAEKKLAGITLGMKPAEVIALLGNPSAILLAQPPVISRSVAGADLNNALGGLPGAAGNMIPESERPNSLILIYHDKKTGIDHEIEIGGEVATTDPGVMGGAPASSGARDATIPVWAYVVRATTLSLAQQELIYQINDTYSLGITITGAGAEAKVTDIVACSFQSFMRNPAEPTRIYDREAVVNFKYTNAETAVKRSMILPAGTSKRVNIGSRLDKVLINQGWPQYFFPFITDSIASIVLSKPEAKIPSVPVKPGSSASSMISAPVSPSDMGIGGGASSAAGDKPITLTDGDKFTFNTGFTKNALMLYTNDNIAITMVDFTVVRIQIGNGVVKPPAPPKITSVTPGG
jgi:hypothetical protein